MINLTPQDLKQGEQVKKEKMEKPSSFATASGAIERPTAAGYGKRMAGPVGARAIQLMNDPVEQQRTANWMKQFGMSNEGMQFNQARMNMENPQPQQEQA